MPESVLITGNSSGLGLALTRLYLDRGYTVYGLSRRGCPLEHELLHDCRCDLARGELIIPALDSLLDGCKSLDIIFLNAAVLGKLQAVNRASTVELESAMQVNVWSNKIILDWLLEHGIGVDCIIAISSGAAVSGSRGWSGYALSKAALNMLMQLYAHEFAGTKIISLAPGLVATAMQDYIADETLVSAAEFPTVKRLRAARGTPDMQTPEQAAQAIAGILPRLGRVQSGTFVDIRDYDDDN